MSFNDRHAPFDAEAAIARVGKGRSIRAYAKDQAVFTQGDAADAVSSTSSRAR